MFKDIFSNDKTPIDTTIVHSKTDFEKAITNALESQKAIGINLRGQNSNGTAFAHWITLWGAVFDEEKNIAAIYVVDNNFAENKVFPYGIYYKDGLPHLFNYPVNEFFKNRYVGEITTLDVGQKFFDEWFAKNP